MAGHQLHLPQQAGAEGVAEALVNGRSLRVLLFHLGSETSISNAAAVDNLTTDSAITAQQVAFDVLDTHDTHLLLKLKSFRIILGLLYADGSDSILKFRFFVWALMVFKARFVWQKEEHGVGFDGLTRSDTDRLPAPLDGRNSSLVICIG